MITNLKNHNTLGVDSICDGLHSFSSVETLETLIDTLNRPISEFKVIGGGSNVILAPRIEKVFLQSSDQSIRLIDEHSDKVWIEVGAGVNWHQFVLHCAQQHWHGLENLALIPGSVGASPVQNIGAYGVEVCEKIHSVNIYDMSKRCQQTLPADACQFSYRNSIFKTPAARNWVITSVIFELDRQFSPVLRYGPLCQLDTSTLDANMLIDQVVDIRSAKLPDPRVLGNVGSFFHNPIVSTSQCIELQSKHPTLPHYRVDDQHDKLAAGWLIDQAGWRGYRENGVGVHSEQALVLVNYDATSCDAILALSQRIVADIQEKYGILLHREPEYVA
ncbi:MAG: UDP-N-acetylmuramate dehydrogenase [Gammaproteobacteria bacterium]|nr:UDP-N-acetylmuramate dehydrogenase [Gammaproteobacteria bacterium]